MLDAVTVDFPDVKVGLDGFDVLWGDAIRRTPDYWCGGFLGVCELWAGLFERLGGGNVHHQDIYPHPAL